MNGIWSKNPETGMVQRYGSLHSSVCWVSGIFGEAPSVCHVSAYPNGQVTPNRLYLPPPIVSSNCSIVGGEVAQTSVCDTHCYATDYTYSVMYIRSTPSYEYEWICRRIFLPLIYWGMNRSIPGKRQSPYLLRIFPSRPSVPLHHQVSPIYPTRFLPEEIFTNHALATPTCPSGDPGNPNQRSLSCFKRRFTNIGARLPRSGGSSRINVLPDDSKL